jgi:hypothetical protein
VGIPFELSSRVGRSRPLAVRDTLGAAGAGEGASLPPPPLACLENDEATARP